MRNDGFVENFLHLPSIDQNNEKIVENYSCWEEFGLKDLMNDESDLRDQNDLIIVMDGHSNDLNDMIDFGWDC